MASELNCDRASYNSYMREYMRRYRARKKLAAALKRPESKIPVPMADAYIMAEDKKGFISRQMLTLWKTA